MTKSQKMGLLIIALTVAIGAALYESNQAREARAEAQKLRAAQASLTKETADLRSLLANVTNRPGNLSPENSGVKNNSADPELLKLRAEVTRLRPLQDDVVALQNMLNQSSAGLAQWKTNELADAGRATPIDALQSYLYSLQITNAAKMRSGIAGDDLDPPTPEALENFIKGELDHPDPMEEDATGYKILSQTWLASDKVRVELQIMTAGGVGVSAPFTLRKVDGEWKLVAFNIRDEQGKISRLEFVRLP